MEDLKILLDSLVANIAALQLQLADTQASANALADLKLAEGKAIGDSEGFARGKAEGLVEGEAIGFAKGVASVPVSSGGFTQEQVDAQIAAAVQIHIDQIGVLMSQIAEMQAAEAVKIAEAVKEAKKAVLEKIKGVKVDDASLIAELEAEVL